MIKPVLFLVVLLLMVPVVYVLFFTKILDRLIGRLRSEHPARPRSGTATIIDVSVVSQTDDQDVCPWLIRNCNDPSLFWSLERGWVSRELADRFSEDDHRTMAISPEGSWFQTTENSE